MKRGLCRPSNFENRTTTGRAIAMLMTEIKIEKRYAAGQEYWRWLYMKKFDNSSNLRPIQFKFAVEYPCRLPGPILGRRRYFFHENLQRADHVVSVADPDPAGSEPFCRIRSKRSDPDRVPDPAENCLKVKEVPVSYKFNQKIRKKSFGSAILHVPVVPALVVARFALVLSVILAELWLNNWKYFQLS